MKEIYTKDKKVDYEAEIDFVSLFNILLYRKWAIITSITFMSIIGVVYSLYSPNIYESKALLVPVDSSDNISGALESYAGIAGINLSSSASDGVSNYKKAIKKITSLTFFEKNILPNIFLPDLMAVKSWDSKTNTLIHDKNIYDVNTNTWIRKYDYPKKQIPSPQESFEVFIKNHLNLIEDRESKFLTISIKHQSAYTAKKWAELIVNEINSLYRKKDKIETEKAISFLNKQISMTNLSEVRQSIAELLQEEAKKLAIIEASEYYVFEYIDSPVIMEEKSYPNRALLCILSALMGLVIGILIVFLQHYFSSKKN